MKYIWKQWVSDIFSRYIINNLKGREKIFTRPSSSKARKQKFCQKTNKCISFLLMNEAEVSLPYKVEDNDGEGESSILVHLARVKIFYLPWLLVFLGSLILNLTYHFLHSGFKKWYQGMRGPFLKQVDFSIGPKKNVSFCWRQCRRSTTEHGRGLRISPVRGSSLREFGPFGSSVGQVEVPWGRSSKLRPPVQPGFPQTHSPSAFPTDTVPCIHYFPPSHASRPRYLPTLLAGGQRKIICGANEFSWPSARGVGI